MVTRAGVSSDSSDSSTMAAGDGALAVLSAGSCKLCALIMKDKVAVSWAERGHCGDCGDWSLVMGRLQSRMCGGWCRWCGASTIPSTSTQH